MARFTERYLHCTYLFYSNYIYQELCFGIKAYDLLKRVQYAVCTAHYLKKYEFVNVSFTCLARFAFVPVTVSFKGEYSVLLFACAL